MRLAVVRRNCRRPTLLRQRQCAVEARIWPVAQRLRFAASAACRARGNRTQASVTIDARTWAIHQQRYMKCDIRVAPSVQGGGLISTCNATVVARQFGVFWQRRPCGVGLQRAPSEHEACDTYVCRPWLRQGAGPAFCSGCAMAEAILARNGGLVAMWAASIAHARRAAHWPLAGTRATGACKGDREAVVQPDGTHGYVDALVLCTRRLRLWG